MNTAKDIAGARSFTWNPTTIERSVYVRLLTRWRDDLLPGENLPKLRGTCDRVPIDKQFLQGYRTLIQSPENGTVPLLFPHVLMGRGHLHLFANSKFPLSALGMLHVRNTVICHAPLSVNDICDLSCGITRQRVMEKGLEFDVDATVRIHGSSNVVWRSVSTYFKRGNFGPPEHAPASPISAIPPGAPHEIYRFQVPTNIGRDYARISGDCNPIHVSNWMAKLFGFRRSIAHGMWTLARMLAQHPHINTASVRLEATFKGPVFSGSDVRVLQHGDGFEVYCDENPRPVLVGCLRPIDAQES